MKTIYILTLGLALAACNNGLEPAGMTRQDAPDGDGEIRLAVTGNALTRADGATDYDVEQLIDEASWPGNQNYFRLTARMASDLSKTYIDGYVMYNTYLSENPWRFCTLTGERKTYYWPGTQAFDFFAYAPAVAAGEAHEPSIAKNGLTYDGFDADEDKHTLTCNLTAFMTGDQTDLKEFIYAYAKNQTQALQGESGVTLRFQHPLAAIFLRISSSFLNTDLYSVTFTGETAQSNGKGVYAEGTGTCGTDGTMWEVKEGVTASDFNIDVYKTMGYEMFIGNLFEKPFLVMPQALADREGLDDVVMKIRYRKPNGNATKTVYLPVTSEVKAWEAGKAYYYGIDLGKDESVTVSVEVEPWNQMGSYTDEGVDEDD